MERPVFVFLMKKITYKYSWKLIAKILGVPVDVSKMPSQEEFKFGSDYKKEAKAEWEQRDMMAQTAHWAARIDAELNSYIARPSTVLIHIYNAQEDADAYASDPNKGLGKSPGTKYEEYMQAIGKQLLHKLGFVRFRLSFWDPRRRGPTIKRIKDALSGVPEKRLQIGDLLDATKSSFGKIRTDSAQVENIVKLLSGKKLLDSWTNFKELRQKYDQIKGLPTGSQEEQEDQARQKQEFANEFLIKIRPEFWDEKLEKYGMGAFGEVKKEKGHVTFRDLLKRSKRVDMERKLLERIADKAEGVDEFQEIAAWLAGVENEPGGPEMAAKYFANRTKAVGMMESAQLLSTGAQWSFFSTSSTEYKGTQALLAGTMRQDIGLDTSKGSSQERMKSLTENVEKFDTTGRRLVAEEQHFRDIQKTYNKRVKTIISTIGAIISTAIAAGIAGATWGAGAPILFASLTTSLIAVLGSLATAVTAAGANYFTQGQAYSHLDTTRDLIIHTLQSLFKAGLSVGVRAFTGGVEDILGVLATHILAHLIRQLGLAASKDTRNVIERFFETSNFADFAARMEDEILSDVIEDVKKISKKVGTKALLGGYKEGEMLIKGEERPQENTTSWERFTKGDKSKDHTTTMEQLQYGYQRGMKRGKRTAKKRKGPLIGALTSYVGTEHDMYISRPENEGSGKKGTIPRDELEQSVVSIISNEILQTQDQSRIKKLQALIRRLKINSQLLDVRFKNLSQQGLVGEVGTWIEEEVGA